MKRPVVFLLWLAAMSAGSAWAQDHVALGAYADYFRLGDEIYFNSGAHNNLRVAFGPYIRF